MIRSAVSGTIFQTDNCLVRGLDYCAVEEVYCEPFVGAKKAKVGKALAFYARETAGTREARPLKKMVSMERSWDLKGLGVLIEQGSAC